VISVWHHHPPRSSFAAKLEKVMLGLSNELELAFFAQSNTSLKTCYIDCCCFSDDALCGFINMLVKSNPTLWAFVQLQTVYNKEISWIYWSTSLFLMDDWKTW
jgi:hypothetical protein